MISEVFVFCDGSAHAPTGFGCGAYLITGDITLPISTLAEGVKTRPFAQTSSTRLELQTLLHALSELRSGISKVTVFTDSQNIVGLPGRREKLERQQFCSKQGKPLSNSDLYQAFFMALDIRPIELIKVKGHSRGQDKTAVERIFALVDQAARRECRAYVERSACSE